ncbi:MAG TPA: hypothetical protein VG125_30075 [Pirellulales bacterium]|jgi:hypothetical protein|nr:hypothetical protein [Pirellulales bacterium]
MEPYSDPRTALYVHAKVQAGNRIEIVSDQFMEGDNVEVFLILSRRPDAAGQSALAFLDSLPAGPRSYPSWDEFERRFQAERDAWDR